jgi:hypothetical protein
VGFSIMAALVSAALFALTTNLQREAASAVPSDDGGLATLVRRLLTDRRWLCAGAIGLLALAMHTLALADGGVLVVQSVMTLGLVLALALEALRSGRRLLLREWGGAVLIVAGVTAVVAAGAPPARDTLDGDGNTLGVTLACGLVGLSALALLLRVRHRVGAAAQARVLAAAGGACFAVDAVFLQQAVRALDARAVLGGLGFLATSMVGSLAVQRAYQVAPLRCVQPAVAAAEPVTAFVIGVALLHEGIRWGTPGFVLLVAGITAIVTGILSGLTSSPVPVPVPAAARVPAGTGGAGTGGAGTGRAGTRNAGTASVGTELAATARVATAKVATASTAA